MPDHWHIAWIGLAETSDQLLATKFLREHLALSLTPLHLQSQAHDHVLRDEERKRGAFQSACHYIFDNPLRAGLVTDWKSWPHLGAMMAGYPTLDPRTTGHWERFWKIHAKFVAPR